MPSFSEHFIEFFFEYVETKDENILEIADAFCFNAENCTNLFKQGLLEILFSFLPSSFDLIFKILSNANENAISWFNEIGGLHPMILMSSDQFAQAANTTLSLSNVPNVLMGIRKVKPTSPSFFLRDDIVIFMPMSFEIAISLDMTSTALTVKNKEISEKVKQHFEYYWYSNTTTLLN